MLYGYTNIYPVYDTCCDTKPPLSTNFCMFFNLFVSKLFLFYGKNIVGILSKLTKFILLN